MSCAESFRAELLKSGIEYSGPIQIDGKLHRFKAEGDRAKNSWYVLYSGSPVLGAYGCWKRDLKDTWCERNGSLTREEQQNLRHRWQDASAKLKAETLARQKKARKVAAWILNRSRPARTMDRYLFRKRVKVFGNVRWYRRSLVLPLHDKNGALHSLQFIDGDGAKKFLTGGRVAGCYFTLADSLAGPVIVCEGYATGATIHDATGGAAICALNSGNLLEVAKAVRELWPQREIIIAGDDDQFTDGNPGLRKATAAAKAIGAKLAVPQFDDLANKPTDFNDLAIAQGLDAVRQQVGSAQVPGTIDGENSGEGSDEETYARLAALSPVEYEHVRKDEAKKLGVRASLLDKLVSALRPRETSGLQGAAVKLADVAPWTEPVNGAQVLNAISETFTLYVVMPKSAADAQALWCAHAHCCRAFQCSPRLNILSPEKSCGKTTDRDAVAQFVPRPLLTENLTTAVLFRLVDSQSPTILADEYDAWLSDNEELRGLLNAGHRKGTMVYRCEGDGNEVRGFAAYAPAVLCGIGALPATLYDRSIPIRLERAKRGELQARFDSRHVEREQELCRKLARWCNDNYDRIEACDPQLPDSAFNRVADNWRPLFAIAEIAGGDWPKRCADAFTKLTRGDDMDAQGIGVMLLADIQQIFAGKWPQPPEGISPLPIERVFSKDLVESLCEMKDRPWPEAQRGKSISERWLARNLSRFGIHPKTLRIGEERAKGYENADFARAFERYLPVQGDFIRDTVTYEGKHAFSIRDKIENVTDAKTACTEGMSRGHACTDGAPESEGLGERDKDAETVIIDELGVARL